MYTCTSIMLYIEREGLHGGEYMENAELVLVSVTVGIGPLCDTR